MYGAMGMASEVTTRLHKLPDETNLYGQQQLNNSYSSRPAFGTTDEINQETGRKQHEIRPLNGQQTDAAACWQATRRDDGAALMAWPDRSVMAGLFQPCVRRPTPANNTEHGGRRPHVNRMGRPATVFLVIVIVIVILNTAIKGKRLDSW